MNAEDPIAGLHRRFDKLESNFEDVQKEQHRMAINLVSVDKRMDLVEVQIQAAQQRETLVVGAINEKLESNLSLVRKLFEKFDAHTATEVEDRKKVLFWLLTTVASVVSSLGFIIFNKLLG